MAFQARRVANASRRTAMTGPGSRETQNLAPTVSIHGYISRPITDRSLNSYEVLLQLKHSFLTFSGTKMERNQGPLFIDTFMGSDGCCYGYCYCLHWTSDDKPGCQLVQTRGAMELL